MRGAARRPRLRGGDLAQPFKLIAFRRVADVAALVEPRPYKSPLAPPEAISQMRLLDGKLDAACLTILERLVADDGAANGSAHDGQAGEPSIAARRAAE